MRVKFDHWVCTCFGFTGARVSDFSRDHDFVGQISSHSAILLFASFSFEGHGIALGVRLCN